VDIVLREVV